MKKQHYTIILIILIFIISMFGISMQRWKEYDVDQYIQVQDDSLLSKSYAFLKENTPVEKFHHLLNNEDSIPLLIKDLELSLRIYRERIMKDSIPFDIFCEYVLPPLIFNESFENWREICYKDFSYLSNRSLNIHQLCDTLNDKLNKNFKFKSLNQKKRKNWSQYQKKMEGDCSDMAQIVIYPLRALGYPVSIDYVLAWGNANGAHSWNVIYNERKMMPFLGLEASIDYKPFLVYDCISDTSKNGYKYPAKIFRKTYSENPEYRSIKNSLGKSALTLELFNDICFKDVTSEYFNVSDIALDSDKDMKDKVFFLSVFNNSAWKPIAASLLNKKNGTYVFKDMKKNMLYLASNNKIGENYKYPFILNEDETLEFLNPSEEKIDIKIDFLFPRIMEYINAWGNISNSSSDIFEDIAFNRSRVRPQVGHEYTLYYYDKIWRKSSTVKAETNNICFSNVPSHALYILMDKNKEIIGRCFTYKNSDIQWW